MEKQKILIVGSSSGIGLTTALHLLARGNFVWGTSRNPERLSPDVLRQRVLQDHTQCQVDKENLRIIKREPNLPEELHDLDKLLEKLVFLKLNTKDPSSIHGAFEEFLLQSGGPPDVLFMNMGMSTFGPLEEASDETIFEQFEANLFGHLRVLREFLPSMRSKKAGKIIFTSSLAALLPIPFSALYSASKSALERIAEGLYIELLPFGIQVAVVEPGDINTSFNLTMAQAMSGEKVADKTDDLPRLLNALPVKKDSPYYQEAANAWNYIIRTLVGCPSPTVVARAIAKLVVREKMPFRIHVGNPSQILAASLGTKLAPAKLELSIVRSLYEVNKK